MDPLTIVIVLALLATVATMLLGVMSMAGGGAWDRDSSTPLMWTRLAFQGLTLVLLIIAVLVR